MKRLTAIILSLILMLCALPFNAVTVSAADGVRTIDALSLGTLNSNISSYESALSNLSDPSYGMKSSYNNYVYALAVKDMANYGSLNTQATVDGAGFTSNMTKWNAYSGTYQPKIGSTAIPSDYYANVLYANGSNDSAFSSTYYFTNLHEAWWNFLGGAGTYSAGVYVYYPDTTIMYDGVTNPAFPIVISMHEFKNSRNYWPQYFYASDSDYSLKDYWYGEKTGFGWPTSNTKRINNNTSNLPGHDESKNGATQLEGQNNYYTFRNSMEYFGNPSATLTTKSGFTWEQRYYYQDTTWNTKDYSNSTTQPVYIINYYKLIHKIDTEKALWTTTAKQATNGSYREGGFANFMNSLDNIEFDPNSYFTSSNNYTGCRDRIDSAYNSIDSPASRTADSHQTDWNKLRTAEDQNDGTKGKARDVYAAGNTKWTTSSWNSFKTAFEAVLDKFDGVVTSTSDKTFSYASLSASDATTLSDNLNTAYAGLTERADFTQVDADRASSTYSSVDYENYTYDSYSAFCTARKAVYDYADIASATKLDTAKSSIQTSLDTAHNNLVSAYAALTAVDDADAYEVFDKAVSVVETEVAQTNKYSSASTASMSGYVNTAKAAVYHTVTAEESSLLGVPANTVMKRTASGATDTATTALLSGVNTVVSASSSYNSYSVTFVINKDGSQVSSNTESGIAFGSTKTYSLGANYTDGSDTVKWTTTSGGGTNTVYGGDTLTKKVSADMTVTADITSAPPSAGYIYKYYNANGKHVFSDTHETSDYSDFESIKTYVAMPNMTVSDWYKEVDEDNKVVTVKAVYTNDGNITLSANSGTITNKNNDTVSAETPVAYNKDFTVTYSGSNSFWAWAVKTGNKYTVASYNSSYSFYSHCDLEFVPIYKDGGNYYYETSSGAVLVTASTISSTPNNYFGLTEDAYIKKKLDIKSPFIGIVGKATVDSTKCRAYCLVTEGASINYTKVGIKFSKAGADPNANASTAITNVLATGQYSVTLSNTSYEDGKFRATVNYDFPYDIALDVMETTDLV